MSLSAGISSLSLDMPSTPRPSGSAESSTPKAVVVASTALSPAGKYYSARTPIGSKLTSPKPRKLSPLPPKQQTLRDQLKTLQEAFSSTKAQAAIETTFKKLEKIDPKETATLAFEAGKIALRQNPKNSFILDQEFSPKTIQCFLNGVKAPTEEELSDLEQDIATLQNKLRVREAKFHQKNPEPEAYHTDEERETYAEKLEDHETNQARLREKIGEKQEELEHLQKKQKMVAKAKVLESKLKEASLLTLQGKQGYPLPIFSVLEAMYGITSEEAFNAILEQGPSGPQDNDYAFLTTLNTLRLFLEDQKQAMRLGLVTFAGLVSKQNHHLIGDIEKAGSVKEQLDIINEAIDQFDHEAGLRLLSDVGNDFRTAIAEFLDASDIATLHATAKLFRDGTMLQRIIGDPSGKGAVIHPLSLLITGQALIGLPGFDPEAGRAPDAGISYFMLEQAFTKAVLVMRNFQARTEFPVEEVEESEEEDEALEVQAAEDAPAAEVVIAPAPGQQVLVEPLAPSFAHGNIEEFEEYYRVTTSALRGRNIQTDWVPPKADPMALHLWLNLIRTTSNLDVTIEERLPIQFKQLKQLERLTIRTDSRDNIPKGLKKKFRGVEIEVIED